MESCISLCNVKLPTKAESLHNSLDVKFLCVLAQEICFIQLFTYCLQTSSKRYNTYRGQIHFLEIILQPAGTPLPWELLNWLRSYLHFVHLHTSNYVCVSAYLTRISLIMNPRSCQWVSVYLFVTLVTTVNVFLCWDAACLYSHHSNWPTSPKHKKGEVLLQKRGFDIT